VCSFEISSNLLHPLLLHCLHFHYYCRHPLNLLLQFRHYYYHQFLLLMAGMMGKERIVLAAPHVEMMSMELIFQTVVRKRKNYY
jgi:hypothetical protein